MARKRERRNGARPRADKAEIHEPPSVYPIAGGAARLSDTCRRLAKTTAAASVGVRGFYFGSGAVRCDRRACCPSCTCEARRCCQYSKDGVLRVRWQAQPVHSLLTLFRIFGRVRTGPS